MPMGYTTPSPPSIALLLLLLCTTSSEAQLPRTMPAPGDCAIYREGGEGYILKTPTWWVNGVIGEIYTQKRRMDICPILGKSKERFTREDWQIMTDAYPCVSSPEKVRDVEAIRIKLTVKAWETPWNKAHGQNGRLYQGHYLNIPLKTDAVIDIDGTLLESCAE